MQGRRIRTAVMRRDQHQDVIGAGLCVLHDHVEIPILIEDPGVQQLVLHLLLAPAAVSGQEVPIRERPLRILVLTLHIRVRRRAVHVEPILLDVLTVVALAIGQPEHPLLENRVRAVPQRQRQAQPLTLIADPGDPILTPPIRARPRLLVREVVPRIPAPAVVLAHRPPLALAQIRAPRLPRSGAGARLLQPLMLGSVELRRSGRHGFGVSRSLKGQLSRSRDPAPTVARGNTVTEPRSPQSGVEQPTGGSRAWASCWIATRC
jgi:hypothetical protein